MIYITNSAWANETYAPYAKLNNPLVFYKSNLRVGDISATTFNPNRPALNMWNPDSASVWESDTYSGDPSVTASVTITLAESASSQVDYIAMAGHNLGDQSWQYSIWLSTGDPFVQITPTRTVLSNEPIVEFFDGDLFDPQLDNATFQIRLTKTLTGSPAVINPAVIAHIKMGQAFPLYRRIFSGFEPSLMKKSKTIQNGSDSGQYLGQVVIRSYRETSEINQQNQPYEFVRDEVVPFLEHCQGDPYYADTADSTFIIAWRPQKHPSELVYAWATDIKYPANESGNSDGGYMQWGISVGAIG